MFDYIALIGLWLCQPEVIPAIKNAIWHWVEWRRSRVYIPEGQEKYYANREKQFEMMFKKK